MSTCLHSVSKPTPPLTPRVPGELDLIAEVRSLLMNGGQCNNVLAHYDTDRRLVEAKHRSAEFQRRALNQFWTVQLLSVASNTSQERFCLVHDGEVADWLKLFKAQVLPFLLAHQLPARVGLNG